LLTRDNDQNRGGGDVSKGRERKERRRGRSWCEVIGCNVSQQKSLKNRICRGGGTKRGARQNRVVGKWLPRAVSAPSKVKDVIEQKYEGTG